MQPVDFWIEYGSTCTWLSVARIGRLASRAGVEVRWQPFFVLPLMAVESRENLHAALRAVGQVPQDVVARARAQPVKDRLKAQTARAKSLGVFGAPSFTVGGELFRGDDRLEEALESARSERVAAT